MITRNIPTIQVGLVVHYSHCLSVDNLYRTELKVLHQLYTHAVSISLKQETVNRNVFEPHNMPLFLSCRVVYIILCLVKVNLGCSAIVPAA
jgi:hypothetical protein